MTCSVAVVGGGPAGLMAAEVLSADGVAVHLFDAMPTVGRKFLLAGIGGLNLTHAEALPAFRSRYGHRADACGRWLDALPPQAVRDWAAGLGVDTFVGSSQRVFPTDMKAAPLLRAWLHRLRHPAAGVPVVFHMRHRWDGTLAPITPAEASVPTEASGTAAGRASAGPAYRLGFHTPAGPVAVQADAVVLALGGGSWARLGSDGAWVPWLTARGVAVAPLRPANCGFDAAVHGRRGWSDHLSQRFAGQPLKGVALRFTDATGQVFERKGECVLTATGLEGSLVYAASAALREAIDAQGQVNLTLNLRPDLAPERVRAEVARPRGGKTLASHLRARLGLGPVHLALLHEVLSKDDLRNEAVLAAAIQALPLTLVAPRPLDEAISSAGGVALEALSDDLMAHALPGVFCAGEMLDWEAPTGGYLLTACLASGRVAGQGVLRYLR
nr:TIGR03862 family flavoprotein [Aquabacterium sp. A08]